MLGIIIRTASEAYFIYTASIIKTIIIIIRVVTEAHFLSELRKFFLTLYSFYTLNIDFHAEI